MGLAERIEWVLEHREDVVKNESHWSLAAGRTRTHVNQVRRRLRDNPDAEQEIGTLNALADAARVSRAWFAHGQGSPDDHEVSVERELRYDALRKILAAKRYQGRWSPPAIAAARSVQLDADEDPGEAWWVEYLDRLDAAIAVSIPKLPRRGDPLSFDDAQSPRTKRNQR